MTARVSSLSSYQRHPRLARAVFYGALGACAAVGGVAAAVGLIVGERVYRHRTWRAAA